MLYLLNEANVEEVVSRILVCCGKETTLIKNGGNIHKTLFSYTYITFGHRDVRERYNSSDAEENR